MAVEALGLMLLMPVAFRVAGVVRTQSALRRWSSRPSRTAVLETARMGARALAVVSRVAGIEGTCLTRSLTLWALLRRRGVDGQVVVGYRRGEGMIEGHAWVEFQGTPLNERPEVIATYTLADEPGDFDELQRRGEKTGIQWP
jgi:hypothetical protein